MCVHQSYRVVSQVSQLGERNLVPPRSSINKVKDLPAWTCYNYTSTLSCNIFFLVKQSKVTHVEQKITKPCKDISSNVYFIYCRDIKPKPSSPQTHAVIVFMQNSTIINFCQIVLPIAIPDFFLPFKDVLYT